MTDLACRTFGGSVLAANDEFFAEKENLIKAESPVHRPATFTLKGQEYDGWETRRRREPAEHDTHDWAIIRLGVPGIVSTVVVDTAHFLGNFPSHAAIDVLGMDGYPSIEELRSTQWTEIVPRSELKGGEENRFDVPSCPRATHVRLRIFPDGGVARLRVLGEPVPDPRELLHLPVNLVGSAIGAQVTACSDSFFSPPSNMLQPGESRFMGDGWETARRRGPGEDWADIWLPGEAYPKVIELTTTHYKGNAPARVSVYGAGDGDWVPLLTDARLQPDTTHRFRVNGAALRRVRVSIAPDGGIGRFRLYGPLTTNGLTAMTLRWFNSLPREQALAALDGDDNATILIDGRPHNTLPYAVRDLVSPT